MRRANDMPDTPPAPTTPSVFADEKPLPSGSARIRLAALYLLACCLLPNLLLSPG
jgi:hypothetical protein